MEQKMLQMYVYISYIHEKLGKSPTGRCKLNKHGNNILFIRLPKLTNWWHLFWHKYGEIITHCFGWETYQLV